MPAAQLGASQIASKLAKGRPQALIGDAGDLGRRAGGWGGGWGPPALPWSGERQWRLHEPQLRHRRVAEVGVDALQDLAALVVDLEGSRGGDAQNERGALARRSPSPGRLDLALRPWRPLQALGAGDRRHLPPGNARPVGDELGGGEPKFLERPSGQ